MEEIKIDIPKGYEFAGVDDDKQQVVFTKIGYHYPKTYEECCEVLKTTRIHIEGLSLDEVERIKPFIKLLRCRDAYWKHMGEQMGLDKPWKPDWKSDEDGCNVVKFCIKNFEEEIVSLETSESNTILAFPTAEMRDAFYENFKELIEECKEFL